MAPNLEEWQHTVIRDMHSKSFKAAEIADFAGCSIRSYYAIRKNLRCFGSTKAPSNGVGRPRSVTPPMLDALCEHLQENPGSYLYEMVDFLQKEFEVCVTAVSVRRALDSIEWTKKKIRRVAKGRNADLRDSYLHNISAFSPEHFVFVDEFGCDKRDGYRQTGWAPFGMTPTEVAPFQRVNRDIRYCQPMQ
jgi:transposase